MTSSRSHVSRGDSAPGVDEVEYRASSVADAPPTAMYRVGEQLHIEPSCRWVARASASMAATACPTWIPASNVECRPRRRVVTDIPSDHAATSSSAYADPTSVRYSDASAGDLSPEQLRQARRASTHFAPCSAAARLAGDDTLRAGTTARRPRRARSRRSCGVRVGNVHVRVNRDELGCAARRRSRLPAATRLTADERFPHGCSVRDSLLTAQPSVRVTCGKWRRNLRSELTFGGRGSGRPYFILNSGLRFSLNAAGLPWRRRTGTPRCRSWCRS